MKDGKSLLDVISRGIRERADKDGTVDGVIAGLLGC